MPTVSHTKKTRQNPASARQPAPAPEPAPAPLAADALKSMIRVAEGASEDIAPQVDDIFVCLREIENVASAIEGVKESVAAACSALKAITEQRQWLLYEARYHEREGGAS